MRVFVALIFASWHTFVVLTCVSAFAGVGIVAWGRHVETEKAEALAAGPPPLTALADYRPETNDRYRREVNLAVVIDPELTRGLNLTRQRRLTSSTDERVMYLALLQMSDPGRNFLFSPFGLGDTLNLGSAEYVEAVHKCDADVDFGGLAIGIP